MKLKKKLNQYEIPLESTSSSKTILTIRKLQMPEDTIELKFDTLFADTENIPHQQTSAQFFLNNKEVQNIQLVFLNLNANKDDGLAKIKLKKPLQEIENFSMWAKKCLLKYASTGTLYQVFQVAHAVMIFESLWESSAWRSENWLWNAAKSALYALEEINRTNDPGENSELDDELLAIILSIKEYFTINQCYDPYTGMSQIVQIDKMIEPQHSPRHYLNQLNATSRQIYD
jgi:hypothetical protein